MIYNWSTGGTLLLLSLMAGSVHVLAPDHWVPASLLCWQRRWKPRAAVGFVLSSLLLHVASGFAIYLVLAPLLERIAVSRFFAFAVGLVVVGAGIRAMRFSRIRDVLGLGSNWLWAALTVASLLGPCESIIPIFLKARQLGMGYLEPFMAFAAGTVLMGGAMIIGGGRIWNSPLHLTRSIRWANRPRSVVPIAAVVATGLIFLLRLR
jgi:hypothetical protein